MAMLIDLPRSGAVTRGSSRRSYTVTSTPRRASSVASRQPARPAPTTATRSVPAPASGIEHRRERGGGAPAIVEGVVHRHRSEPDHVRPAGVGEDPELVPQPLGERPHGAA